MPASGHLLCYACGMWPCGKECRLHSNSNRRAPDVRVSAAVSKEEEEHEAWYQLEHKAPFGDKAYSVSVFNHSVRADCSWSVSQKTIDGITMLMPTGMVRAAPIPHAFIVTFGSSCSTACIHNAGNGEAASAVRCASALGLPHHSTEKAGGGQRGGMVGERPGWNAANERERHARSELGNVGVEGTD